MEKSDRTSRHTTVQFCHEEHESQRQYTYIHMSRNDKHCVGNTGERRLFIYIRTSNMP